MAGETLQGAARFTLEARKSRFLAVPKDIGYVPALDPRKSSRFRLDHPQDRLPP